MEIVKSVFNSLGWLWYLIPFLMIVVILKSNWFKGVFGEFLVNCFLSILSPKSYTVISNITLQTAEGTTQIDHLVISQFGIFVIETKNMKGWIFGSAQQKQWTQKIYRKTYSFQNPLYQNYKHINVLASLLDCDQTLFHSVIVFVGNSEFKTPMPANVTYAYGCIRYIKTFSQHKLSRDECDQFIKDINEFKLASGIKTNLKHRQHVKNIIANNNEQIINKSAVKLCPSCGEKMLIRTAKHGINKGKKFWGCSAFPKCRRTKKIDSGND